MSPLCNVNRFNAATARGAYPSGMTVTCTKPLEFRNEIETLIAEIDACIPDASVASDREHELQEQVYRERCSQARSLSEMLIAHGGQRWAQLDGDAHRIREALRMSLDFFRRML